MGNLFWNLVSLGKNNNKNIDALDSCKLSDKKKQQQQKKKKTRTPHSAGCKDP
jgi:hypothetical protein